MASTALLESERVATVPDGYLKFGNELVGKWWMPRTANGSVVLIVPGIHQFTDLYDPIGERLASEGYAVFSYDHRGFGRSGGDRGMAWDGAWDEAQENILLAARLAAGKKAEEGKLFAIGHSLGGLLLTLVAQSGNCGTKACPINGLILSGPSNRPMPGCVVATLKCVFYCIACCRTRSGVVMKFDLSTASRNKEFIAKWEAADESCVDNPDRPFKAGYLIGAFNAFRSMQQGWKGFKTPCLILFPEGDKHHESGACEYTHKNLIANGTDVTMKKYAGYFHEVLHDAGSYAPGANLPLDDSIKWMRDQALRPTTM